MKVSLAGGCLPHCCWEAAGPTRVYTDAQCLVLVYVMLRSRKLNDDDDDDDNDGNDG